MQISIRAKSLAADLLDRSGMVRYSLRKRSGDNILILMYHRVLPFAEAHARLQAGMYVVPETFESHIRYLKDTFHVISISEINQRTKDQQDRRDDHPFCVLTFDDGWYDFYRYAYPILKEHNVPATVFLATDFVGTARWFWTDLLTRYFYAWEGAGTRRLKGAARASSPLIRRLEETGGSAENRLEQVIEAMKALPIEEISCILSALSERWGIDTAPREREFLTWDEAREMRRSGLVSFGSHTASHRILTMLREDDIDRELRRSKDRLVAEGVADPQCLPFAYPNGDYNGKTVELVKKHDYSLAVTTRKGWVPIGGNEEPYELRRIGIHQDMASTRAMFGCRIVQFL